MKKLWIAALALSSSVAAQDYPTKPITMVLPFPPGGVAEIVGRPLASIMEKSLKQPIVLINRPGAGGAVGMASVAKGPADGYTILMGLSSISIFPVSDRINGKEPPYELRDFAPIALVTADPTVLVVRADGPYKTVKDFVDAAKANPGKINYSSSGVYGTLHVAMEIFANAAG
ncbi:MAG TPA: tripartite tricarboxylate transporter substrate binding protein, partial [Burkholderiales bacterium]